MNGYTFEMPQDKLKMMIFFKVVVVIDDISFNIQYVVTCLPIDVVCLN